jgi:hypothetical protein
MCGPEGGGIPESLVAMMTQGWVLSREDIACAVKEKQETELRQQAEAAAALELKRSGLNAALLELVGSESVNEKSRIGEFKLACKKRGCTGTELALLTRSVQLKQKLLELFPAAARQILDARAAILRPPAGAPAVLISKKRKGEVKDKRKAKRPSSDSDSESDDESEESNVEEAGVFVRRCGREGGGRWHQHRPKCDGDIRRRILRLVAGCGGIRCEQRADYSRSRWRQDWRGNGQ